MNEIWYNKTSWKYLQDLFESSFSLTELLTVEVARNFVVADTNAEAFCVEFCCFVQCHTFVLLLLHLIQLLSIYMTMAHF
jgi:hypothetical protein